jgi:hypothetical protein
MIGLLIMVAMWVMYRPSLTDSPQRDEEDEEHWRTSTAQARREHNAWQQDCEDDNESTGPGIDGVLHLDRQWWSEQGGARTYLANPGRQDDDDENLFGPSPTTDAEYDLFEDLAEAYRDDNVRLALLQEEIDIDTASYEQVLGNIGQ